ncbi:MAG: glycosyltransferase family 2 protein [Acidobacteriota bacterium]
MPTELPAGQGTVPAGDRLWVVLPVYNEAGAIETVIREWLPVLERADPGFVLLVVDDGSTDGTGRLLERLAQGEPRIRIESIANRGHGGACRRGYTLATGPTSDASWILQIDSDGQCAPEDFPAFWQGRREHLAQFGRRRHRGDGWVRTAASRALALLVGAAAGRRIADPNVPFRLLRRDVLTRCLARAAAVDVALFNAALTVVCVDETAVRWIDIQFRRRLAGQSHYRPARMGRLASELLGWLVARHRPARALAALAWCALAGAVAVYAARNLGSEAIWYDEAVQVHTALGVHPLAPPFTKIGGLREAVARNRGDELDPGGFGILLFGWIRVVGQGIPAMRLLCGLLVVAGLGALAALAGRWIRSPLAPPAAVALALLDPLVREHAVEVRPYALEMAAVWVAFWAVDRFLERPTRGWALSLGCALAALVSARYSGFLTGGALAAALLAQALALRRTAPAESPRFQALLGLVFLPPLVVLAAIARWSLPGLVGRSTWAGGQMVAYLQPYTAAGLAPGELAMRALHNLTLPAVFALTLTAGLALGPRRSAAWAASGALLVRRSAIVLLLLTALLWRWHPWEPATKWSLYLRVVSTVCALRLVADGLPHVRGALGRRVAAVVALGIVAVGAGLTTERRVERSDVALPALEAIGDGRAGAMSDGAVAVDVHPYPALRYHYEFGALRGHREYPRVFRLPIDGVEIPRVEMCAARWFLTFDSIPHLEARYPALLFAADPVAPNLLRIAPRDPLAPCGG